MARTSLEGLSAVPANLSRPEPPSELTDEEKEYWRSIVATKPVEWFTRDSHPLLVQYCRHRTRAYQVAKMIETAEEDGGNLKTLFEMEAKQSQALATLATKLRIAQQSRYGARGASGAADRVAQQAVKPWEIGVKTA